MPMSAATAVSQGLDLRAIADAVAPDGFRFDPFGLVSGYKAYAIYTALDARSDADLAAMGLSRAELPRTAMEAVKVLRAR
jgi:hypothetical protein